MKLLPLSLLVLATAGDIAPAAVAGQQVMVMEGQKAVSDPVARPNGEVDMLVLDVPVAPVQQAPTMMMVVADNRATPREITVEPGKGAIGVCQYVQKVNGDGDLNARYALEPASYLHDLLMNGNEVGGLAEEIDLNSAIVTVLQPPKHGSLGAQPKYAYQPNTGYVGNDKVTFQVEGQDLIDGQPMKYNLVFFIKVIPEAIIDSSNQDMLDKKYCPARSWRISST